MKNLGTGRFTAGDMTARVVRGPRDLITGCSPWFPVNRYFQQKQTIVLINFVFLEFIYLFIFYLHFSMRSFSAAVPKEGQQRSLCRACPLCLLSPLCVVVWPSTSLEYSDLSQVLMIWVHYCCYYILFSISQTFL